VLEVVRSILEYGLAKEEISLRRDKSEKSWAGIALAMRERIET
jgi:predicted component of type VI protein secretion system